jgi:hypothetical protein
MKLTSSEKKDLLIGVIFVVVVGVITKIILHYTPLLTVNPNP